MQLRAAVRHRSGDLRVEDPQLPHHHTRGSRRSRSQHQARRLPLRVCGRSSAAEQRSPKPPRAGSSPAVRAKAPATAEWRRSLTTQQWMQRTGPRAGRCSMGGRVAAIAAGCKPVVSGHRGFESHPPNERAQSSPPPDIAQLVQSACFGSRRPQVRILLSGRTRAKRSIGLLLLVNRHPRRPDLVRAPHAPLAQLARALGS